MEKKWTKERVIKEIAEWAFCFLIAYVIYLLLNFFIGTISSVKQESMQNTAIEGEKLVVQRPTIFKKELKYGDIITFVAPSDSIRQVGAEKGELIQGQKAYANYDEHNGFDAFVYDFMGIGKKSYIKRIIGLPGDHIEIMETGEVVRNGEILAEPYLKDGATNQNGEFINIIVPENAIFAMGDNRLMSMDCRSFGCIPMDKIDGYIVYRIWPFSRWGQLQ